MANHTMEASWAARLEERMEASQAARLKKYEEQARLVRQECGASPSVTNATVYHPNYLNIGLLTALLFIAAILIWRNWDVVTKVWGITAKLLHTLRRHYLLAVFVLLVVLLLASVTAGYMTSYGDSRFRYAISDFVDGISDQFYTTSYVHTPEYKDYLACEKRARNF